MLRPKVRWSLLVVALLLNACVGSKSEGAKFRQMFLERGSGRAFLKNWRSTPWSSSTRYSCTECRKYPPRQ